MIAQDSTTTTVRDTDRDPMRRLTHDIRARLSGILGFAELIQDGKSGPVTAEQREFLDDIMTSAREILDLMDTLVSAAPPGPEPTSTTLDASVDIQQDIDFDSGRPTILVVEDDPRDREAIQGMLEAAGYDVQCASTGARALLRARQRKFAGITLDITLSDMTGWDVLKGVRRLSCNLDTPVIVVSLSPNRSEAAAFAVTDIVPKSLVASELLPALERAGVGAKQAHTVMVVDNNMTMLRLASAVLSHHGYRVHGHNSTVPALAAVAHERPAAILLDLVMPGVDGFEFLDRLRSTPAGRKIPVIVWTVKDLTAGEMDKLRAAVQAVVLKKTGLHELVETLEAWMPAPVRG